MGYIPVENQDSLPDIFWQQNTTSQRINVWRGYSFENVCFNHIEQIKRALGISGVSTTHSAWTKMADEEHGTQIDLIISRKDNVTNMCEIKFYGGLFAVDKNTRPVCRHHIPGGIHQEHHFP